MPATTHSGPIKIYISERDRWNTIIEFDEKRFVVYDRLEPGPSFEVLGAEVVLHIRVRAPGVEFLKMPEEIEEQFFAKDLSETASTKRKRRRQSW